MKRVVREGCPETNSSSSHSLLITKNNTKVTAADIKWDPNKDNNDDAIYFGKDNRLRLGDVSDGFGRYPFKILSTFQEKLEYAMCEFLAGLYEDDPEWDRIYGEFHSIVKDLYPEFDDFRIRMTDVDIYLDQNGNDIPMRNLIYDGWDSETQSCKYCYLDENWNKQPAILNEKEYMEMPAIGRIDHQSMGTLKNFLKEKNISLKEFLTNRCYVIVQDGDEFNDFERYMRAGFIDKDFITEIYTTRGEDLEYAEWLKEEENRK